MYALKSILTTLISFYFLGLKAEVFYGQIKSFCIALSLSSYWSNSNNNKFRISQRLINTPPLDILPKEMRKVYFRSLENPERILDIKAKEGQTSMHVQIALMLGARLTEKMDLLPYISFNLIGGEWTRTIVLCGPISTTGHGFFKKYLHTFKYSKLHWCKSEYRAYTFYLT